VRERVDGGWTLPGGWADVGDAPAAMVEREIWEESGVHARARRLVGVYDTNREHGPWDVFHAYKLVFLCDYVDGEPGASEETSDARFYDRATIPAELSGTRIARRHLEDIYRFLEDGAAQAVFD
jgi:ADP-ribose pyrophosphatase YjhB (NUDIX family)